MGVSRPLVENHRPVVTRPPILASGGPLPQIGCGQAEPPGRFAEVVRTVTPAAGGGATSDPAPRWSIPAVQPDRRPPGRSAPSASTVRSFPTYTVRAGAQPSSSQACANTAGSGLPTRGCPCPPAPQRRQPGVLELVPLVLHGVVGDPAERHLRGVQGLGKRPPAAAPWRPRRRDRPRSRPRTTRHRAPARRPAWRASARNRRCWRKLS